jgi:hypothetical protein
MCRRMFKRTTSFQHPQTVIEQLHQWLLLTPGLAGLIASRLEEKRIAELRRPRHGPRGEQLPNAHAHAMQGGSDEAISAELLVGPEGLVVHSAEGECTSSNGHALEIELQRRPLVSSEHAYCRGDANRVALELVDNCSLCIQLCSVVAAAGDAARISSADLSRSSAHPGCHFESIRVDTAAGSGC